MKTQETSQVEVTPTQLPRKESKITRERRETNERIKAVEDKGYKVHINHKRLCTKPGSRRRFGKKHTFTPSERDYLNFGGSTTVRIQPGAGAGQSIGKVKCYAHTPFDRMEGIKQALKLAVADGKSLGFAL
jgi:hypothetical protein